MITFVLVPSILLSCKLQYNGQVLHALNSLKMFSILYATYVSAYNFKISYKLFDEHFSVTENAISPSFHELPK